MIGAGELAFAPLIADPAGYQLTAGPALHAEAPGSR
jgi:hypothetical protein